MKKKPLTTFTLFFILVFLTGCATTYKPALNSEIRNEISTIKIISITAQEEIDAQFIPSYTGAAAGAQGGFIGALIGSAVDASINNSRAKKAESKVESYRNLLTDFDFEAELAQTLHTSMQTVQWAETSDIEKDIQLEDLKIKDYVNSVGEDAVLLVNSHFSFTPDFNSLNVDALVEFYPSGNKSGSEKTIKPLFKRFFQYQAQKRDPNKSLSTNGSINYMTQEEYDQKLANLEAKHDKKIASATGQVLELYEEKKAKAIKRFQRNSIISERKNTLHSSWTKETIEDALREGIDHLAHLIVFDLNDSLTADDYKQAEITIPGINSLGVSPNSGFKAYKLSEYQGHTIYRLQNGSVYSVPVGEALQQRAMVQ